jgi:flagellin-specific chaperone FliS
MTTTIALSAKSHKELTLLKIEEGFKNMDELISDLIIEHKKNKLIRASEIIRGRMKELNLSLSDLIE